MNFLVVPARNDLPWYKFKISLSSVIYTLRFRYNTRMQRYIIDIGDSANNPIIVGLPLLINRDVNGQYVLTGLPVGTLFATDDTNLDTQPSRNSFGNDHTLFYADPDSDPAFNV